MVPAAPNPTKVMLYIAERKAMGVDLGVEQIVVNTLKGKHREPEHLARNPFGTLPVLALYNSLAHWSRGHHIHMELGRPLRLRKDHLQTWALPCLLAASF